MTPVEAERVIAMEMLAGLRPCGPWGVSVGDHGQRRLPIDPRSLLRAIPPTWVTDQADWYWADERGIGYAVCGCSGSTTLIACSGGDQADLDRLQLLIEAHVALVRDGS